MNDAEYPPDVAEELDKGVSQSYRVLRWPERILCGLTAQWGSCKRCAAEVEP